ncbi:preprotein translocase subunit SecA [Halobacteriovorax marinus]|uniref:Preprotein translocase subunit SecA n=1 Tax=Halobacteriovorax marinus TaxID=97084 RepID=A0A1Y5FH66_9BACT|nr:preprotein translocase subunit SecA [Halobacteriovorax marinus]
MTSEKENNKETSHDHSHEGHVHGPNCNHGHDKMQPIVRQSPKVGRNDPCSCGSKKKFKKCCGK